MPVSSAINKILWSSDIYSFYLSRGRVENITFSPPDPWPGDPVLGEEIFQGNYNFGGQRFRSPSSPSWYPNGVYEEWLEDMHGFSWLRHLKARSGSLARKHAKGIISSWLEKYGRWHEFSWRHDVLARRISAWLSNSSFLFTEPDKSFSDIFLKSLTKQSRHLHSISRRGLFNKIERYMSTDKASFVKICVIRG